MFHFRLTAEGFAELPPALRDALGVQVGDLVGYEIAEGVVTLKRVDADDPFENPFALFTEWADELDSEAFDNL
jgi:bifunctional DNA-binding transcriptional regulator/antitoxin component of YhaV-PrlF toxin-antitoxin module